METSDTIPAAVDPYATRAGGGQAGEVPCLVVVWSHGDPRRVGEVLHIPTSSNKGFVFGRGAGRSSSDGPRLPLVRLRPGQDEPQPPVESESLSRNQLRLKRTTGNRLFVQNTGLESILINGHLIEGEGAGDERELYEDDVLEVKSQMALLVERRPLALPRFPKGITYPAFDFGQADAFGIVGESPICWALRSDLAFRAAADLHTLILGPSGAGKELAAKALHGLSSRGAATLVARNASTFTESLIDVALNGNIKDFPNPGTPMSVGCFEQAHESSFFLDEIGEMSTQLQAQLLRVMETRQYVRLGDGKPSDSDFRLLAATNRDLSSLKHDLVPRFGLRISLPSLEDRRGDIPLIARHLIRQLAAGPFKALACFVGADGEPRFSPRIITALLRVSYPGNIRDLKYFLTNSAETSMNRDYIVPGPALLEEVRAEAIRRSPDAPVPPADPQTVTLKDLRNALIEHGTRKSAAPRIGLTERQFTHILESHGTNQRDLLRTPVSDL